MLVFIIRLSGLKGNMRALVKAYLFKIRRVCICIPTRRGCNLARREIVCVITTPRLAMEKKDVAIFLC